MWIGFLGVLIGFGLIAWLPTFPESSATGVVALVLLFGPVTIYLPYQMAHGGLRKETLLQRAGTILSGVSFCASMTIILYLLGAGFIRHFY